MAPSGRLQDSLSQTLATIEIFTPDLAEIRAGTSIVSSRGGELALRVPNSVYAVPAGGQGGLQNRPAVVCLEDAGSSVTYSGVEYGSLRQAYLYGLHREYGSIEEKLYLEGDLVKGELVNGTGFDLRDCKLLLGGRLISLGNLPAGGSARVEEVLEKGRYPAGRERLLMEIGGRNEPGEPFFLERQMLSQFSNDNRMENSIQFLGPFPCTCLKGIFFCPRAFWFRLHRGIMGFRSILNTMRKEWPFRVRSNYVMTWTRQG